MQLVVQYLFAFLSGVTAPLKGYRTAISALLSLVMMLAGVVTGDAVLFAAGFAQLMSIVGLKPDDPLPLATPVK